MFWFVIAPIYIVVSGMAFVLLGNKFSPKDYWESPAPFFGSLVWPVFLPMVLGGTIGKVLIGGGNGETKTEKRRRIEIEEAEHRLRVAEIESRTTRELEKALL